MFIALDGGVALWRNESKVPAMSAAWAALGTVVVKEALYRYTRRVGEALNAPSLLASARITAATSWRAARCSWGASARGRGCLGSTRWRRCSSA
ncbi:MAG: hypothetical protein IPI35_08360 [Deltaproteobacteria bacterium]|nr:hypothetical protein [Deltaproteobacteria bacterium]